MNEASVKNTLRVKIGETDLRWKVKCIEGFRPVITIYYPSEKAFYASCSFKKGEASQTVEGERMREEAHRVRRCCLEAYPMAKVGFDIEARDEMLSKSLETAILHWFANGERGLSSKAMAFAVAGIHVVSEHCRKRYPYDTGDLARCIQFLHDVPEAREHMAKVAALSSTWARLIQHWDKLESTYSDECKISLRQPNYQFDKTADLLKQIVKGSK